MKNLLSRLAVAWLIISLCALLSACIIVISLYGMARIGLAPYAAAKQFPNHNKEVINDIFTGKPHI